MNNVELMEIPKHVPEHEKKGASNPRLQKLNQVMVAGETNAG